MAESEFHAGAAGPSCAGTLAWAAGVLVLAIAAGLLFRADAPFAWGAFAGVMVLGPLTGRLLLPVIAAARD